MRPIVLTVLMLLCVAVYSQQTEYEPLIEFAEETETQPITENVVGQNTTAPVEIKRVPFEWNMKTLHLYRYEVMVIGIILLYTMHYRWGKSKNAQIIQKFYRHTYMFLGENFAHVGFSKQNNLDPFVGESAHEVMYYASGRENVQSIQMKFNLRKRQDMLYLYLYEFISPDKDLVTIDLPVKTDLMMVFCMASKKGLKLLYENNLDLKKLTGNWDLKNITQFHILGQSYQCVDMVFDNYLVKRINTLQGVIHSLHYTDQKMFSNYGGHLRAVLNANPQKPQLLLSALQVLLYLVDKVVSIKLTKNMKQSAIKARQVLNASKQKIELEKHKQTLQKEKEQKLRQEQARIRSLPADKQKKEEDKKKKKEINKYMKSKVMKS